MRYNQVFSHMIHTMKPYIRDKSIWIKMILVIPINTVLPYFFMTKAFCNPDEITAIFYTNLAWSYLYFSVIESFLSKEMIISSHKINNLFISPSNIYDWIIGQTIGINLFYTCTIFISAFLTSIVGGITINYKFIILIFIIAYITSFSLNMFVFSLQLYFNRAFHILNFSMDVIQTLSCVLYPLTAMPVLLKGISILIPITWSNEFLRGNDLYTLFPWLLCNIILIFISVVLVRRSIKNFKQRGGIYV
ncbi:MAG: hypothetical protein ACRCXT_18160 [Paraclostridium sp.]